MSRLAELFGQSATLWLSAIFSVCGTMQFGYQLGVLNLPMSQLQASLDFNGDFKTSSLVTSMLVGGFLGAISSGFMADSLGPKRALVVTNLPVAIGIALSTAMPVSAGLITLIAARLLIGLAVGLFVTLVPRYLAEISPVEVRGAFGTFNQLTVSAGVLFSFLTGVPYGMDDGQVDERVLETWWRFMFGFGGVFSLAMWLLSLWAVESPYWLRSRGREGKACETEDALRPRAPTCGRDGEGGARVCPQCDEAILEGCQNEVATGDGEKRAVQFGNGVCRCERDGRAMVLRGEDAGTSGVEAEGAVGVRRGGEVGSEDTVLSGGGAAEWDGEGEAEGGTGLLKIFDPQYRRIMYLATVTVCLLQLSGINTAIIYSGSLLEDAGFSERMQVVGVVIIGLILFLGVLPASYFMDIAGRRTLMMVSHAGMAASLAGVSAVGFAADGSDKTAAAVSLALICLFCLFFSVGAGPVPFTYVAEIVPEEIRGPGLGFATGTHWLANIAVGVSFPFLMSGLGQGGAYLIYAGLNVGGLLFATFHMVETKKRTLRELGRMLSSKPAPKAAQRRCIVD